MTTSRSTTGGPAPGLTIHDDATAGPTAGRATAWSAMRNLPCSGRDRTWQLLAARPSRAVASTVARPHRLEALLPTPQVQSVIHGRDPRPRQSPPDSDGRCGTHRWSTSMIATALHNLAGTCREHARSARRLDAQLDLASTTAAPVLDSIATVHGGSVGAHQGDSPCKPRSGAAPARAPRWPGSRACERGTAMGLVASRCTAVTRRTRRPALARSPRSGWWPSVRASMLEPVIARLCSSNLSTSRPHDAVQPTRWSSRSRRLLPRPSQSADTPAEVRRSSDRRHRRHGSLARLPSTADPGRSEAGERLTRGHLLPG